MGGIQCNSYSLFLFSVAQVVRNLKVANTIDPKEVRLASIMSKNLLEQLQLCSLSCSVQNLFATPGHV